MFYKEKISIIIPYYKKKKYFQKTILSLKNQTFKKFKVIIIYDDSNLCEIKFIKKITKKIKKKIIINKKNIGAGLSRNKGIKNCKSEYICFLDADDYWKKDKLKIQYNYMKKNNLDISHCSYNVVKNNQVISIRKAKTLNYFQLLKSCDIGLSTVMIRTKILKNKNFPNLKTKEDYVLWLKLAKQNFIFNAINCVLVNWRDTENSLSKNFLQKIADAFRVYYYYERQNFFLSLFSVFRLSLNFLIKKI